VVDPDWAGRLFIPYDGLLARGQVRRDRAVSVSGTTVQLASGTAICADHIVLPTGSAHRYPAKTDVDEAARGEQMLRATHRELTRGLCASKIVRRFPAL
jgi:apoptosis-inducing factor 2